MIMLHGLCVMYHLCIALISLHSVYIVHSVDAGILHYKLCIKIMYIVIAI